MSHGQDKSARLFPASTSTSTRVAVFGPANRSHECVPEPNGAHKFKTHKDIKAATRVTICQPTTTSNNNKSMLLNLQTQQNAN